MHHLFRRITLPVLAVGVLTLPALGAAYADGGAAPADTPPAGLLCNGAAPTMWATADNQTITGTDGNDIIAANGFHGLTLRGGAGNDTICGANDPAATATGTTLDGGAGDDVLISTGGRDRLVGGAGNDRLNGTIHNDVVYTTDGYTFGTAGISVNLPAGTVTGARTGTDTLVGLDQARIFGTDGSDTFVGDDTANWFDGGSGADKIAGNGGNDWFHAVDPYYVHGGGGNDTILLGFGGTAVGGADNDLIVADPNNTLSGASPDSGTAVAGYVLKGKGGDDTFKLNTLKTDANTWNPAPALRWRGSIVGGKGNNTVDMGWLGSQGVRVSLHSGTANWPTGVATVSDLDRVIGTSGNDVLIGGPENDHLNGGAGNDHLQGKKGNDSLHGKSGDDTLVAGSGNDRAVGGSGNDTCKAAEHMQGC